MAYHLYPLTASQRMLQNACEEFGTTQVLTIGVCFHTHAGGFFSVKGMSDGRD